MISLVVSSHAVMKALTQKDIRIPVFIAALLATAKTKDVFAGFGCTSHEHSTSEKAIISARQRENRTRQNNLNSLRESM